jgi:tRNA G18 (ribose-2'-O)-methylase SpoU
MSPLTQHTPTLHPVNAAEPAVRRYSLLRRNLLPREEQATAVCGLWAHEFLLRTDASIEAFLWCPPRFSGSRSQGDVRHTDRVQACVDAVAARAESSYLISERTLRRVHPGVSAPAMLSVVRLPTWRDDALLSSNARLLLVADGIEYAGNLGTLVRTVDACGADGLLLTNAVARLTNPKVFVASRGTVLTTPALEYPSVHAARKALCTAGFTVYVADPSAERDYRRTSYGPGRLAIVVGSEGKGVAPDWSVADLDRVAIPMAGHADSLNVAASAAVLLFDARGRSDDPALAG